LVCGDEQFLMLYNGLKWIQRKQSSVIFINENENCRKQKYNEFANQKTKAKKY